MINKISILSIFLLVLCSCQKNLKEQNNSESNINIQFADDKGNKISKSELAKSTEIFDYDKVYYDRDNVPDTARSFYKQGKKYQEEADNKKAMEEFRKAHKEVPDWIYPIYNLAVLYLLEDDFENSLKYYQLSDQIAPKGFYDTKIALHSLQREKTGDLKKGVYKNYLLLELSGVLTIESSINQSTYELTIGELLKNAQNFAPLWKDYALFLESTEEKLDAIEKGLAQNPDVKTKGILLINKAIFSNENGNYQRATEILVGVIFDPNSTISNVEMAKYILNLMTEK